MKKIQGAFVKNAFPPRKLQPQKWEYGHCMIVAGSRRLFGAAILAAQAALRGGAGLVTLAIPRSLHTVAYGRTLEALRLPLPETEEGTISYEALGAIEAHARERGVTSLVIGPGLTRQESTAELVAALCAQLQMPMILDADAINARPPLPSHSFRCLTPHRKEFARLSGVSEKDAVEKAPELARQFLGKNPRAALVLKGYHSKIFWKSDAWENTTGNPGMAKGGSGDVLSGLMGAFLAQKAAGQPVSDEACLQAVLSAVYLHGLAGDLSARELTQQAMNAQDILGYLPQAFKKAGIK